MCINSLIGKQLPVYGDGQNVRDWLYVGDHCSALDVVIHRGFAGETYNIGGNNEVKNIDLVQMLCQLMDELAPHLPVSPCDKLITFVKDRPGHDRRYAINSTKIKTQLSWTPTVDIQTDCVKRLNGISLTATGGNLYYQRSIRNITDKFIFRHQNFNK
jgi:dTDP-glucose 4,6-dehydratase